MKQVLIVLLCLAHVAAASLAQVTISAGEPASRPTPAATGPSIKDLPKLVEQLKSDRDWWGAYRKLVQLAEGEFETEVMESTVALWHACKDEAVRERTFLIPARLNRRTHYRQRREAIDEEIAALARLSTRLQGEIGKLGETAAARDLGKTADELGIKIARLKKTVADWDKSDPEFGPPVEVTLSFGEGGEDEDAEPMEIDEKPASRPGDKKEEPRDDRGAREQVGAPKSGDLRRVAWVRPFKDALAQGQKAGRVVLVKPLMGGSNVPDETGVPCGGKRDCEGSW